MIKIKVNQKEIAVNEGATVATAVFLSDASSFRRSVSGEKRFPLCGMGICFECRVSINGVPNLRSCQIPVREGMVIKTDA